MARPHYTNPATYLIVGLVLFLLLGLNIGLSFLPLGTWKFYVLTGIPAMQAVLVLLFLMNLRKTDALTWLFTGTGLYLLLILILLGLSDYLTRATTQPPNLGS